MTRMLAIAKELIAFQGFDFKNTLVGLFESLYANADDPSAAQQSKECAEIQALLKKRFGLSIVLDFNNNKPPQTMPNIGNYNHVLNTVLFDGVFEDQEKALLAAINKDPKRMGMVDLKSGRVSGAYSDVEMPIYMGYKYIRKYWTPAQAAAVLMHEVGHCFLAFEFMYRTYRASQFLAWMHQCKTGRGSVSYEYAVESSIERLLKEGIIKEPKALEQTLVVKNDTARAVIVYSQVWRTLGNDFGSNAATGPSYEALSDNFAVRLGFGQELSEALAKDHIVVPAGFASTLLGILKEIIVIFGAGFLITVGGWATIVTIFLVAANFGLGGYSDIGVQQSAVYAKGMRRLEQLHTGIIEMLKDPDLPSKDRNELIDQSRTIEKLLANSQDITESIFDAVANLVFSKRAAAKAALELEADLERLASNKLFVSAAALKSSV